MQTILYVFMVAWMDRWRYMHFPNIKICIKIISKKIKTVVASREKSTKGFTCNIVFLE